VVKTSGNHYPLKRFLYFPSQGNQQPDSEGAPTMSMFSKQTKSQTHLDKGVKLRKEGQLDAALAELQQALDLDPNLPRTLYQTGLARQQKKDFDEAIACYQKLIEQQPENGAAHLQIGRVLVEQNRHREALDAYRKALEFQPNQPARFHIERGDLLIQLDLDKEEAIAAYNRAIKLDSNLPLSIYKKLGDALIQSGKNEEAVVAYRTALELNPNLPANIRNMLMDALNQTGKIEEVIAAYHKALELNPNLPVNIRKKLEDALELSGLLQEVIADKAPESSALVNKAYLTSWSFGNKEEERQRFQKQVLMMLENPTPIYIQFGFAKTPFRNFLNLDISAGLLDKVKIPHDMHNRIFIYPWLDGPLPIPSNCIDFAFSEDMFEHLNQKQQFLFLAEVLRVLKPGCFHRINTPCIAASMAAHSDFSRGFEGVYQEEWDRWHHVNVPTRNLVDEMGSIVGYRHVLFNSRNGSVSGIGFIEYRPGNDRDDITGNIYADLMK